MILGKKISYALIFSCILSAGVTTAHANVTDLIDRLTILKQNLEKLSNKLPPQIVFSITRASKKPGKNYKYVIFTSNMTITNTSSTKTICIKHFVNLTHQDTLLQPKETKKISHSTGQIISLKITGEQIAFDVKNPIKIIYTDAAENPLPNQKSFDSGHNLKFELREKPDGSWLFVKLS